MKIGMIFPGYGDQFVGMCKELYDTSRLIQEYFEEASNCLNSNLIKLCFASSDAELSKIQNAYPAIFLVGASIAAQLKEEGIKPHMVAGYNTGEFTALCAAQSISFPDGLYLLNKYALSYQELLDEVKDVALIRALGIEAVELEEICKEIRETGAAVHVALQLCHNEHIISGLVPAVERVTARLGECEGVKIKAADAEHGLHSSLMDPVVSRLTMYLEKVDFHDPAVPVISCVSGESITSADTARSHSVGQIHNTIAWPKVVAQFESCDVILQIGPGNSLHSMLQECYPNKQIITVNKPEDIQIVKSVCIKQEPNLMEPVNE